MDMFLNVFPSISTFFLVVQRIPLVGTWRKVQFLITTSGVYVTFSATYFGCPLTVSLRLAGSSSLNRTTIVFKSFPFSPGAETTSSTV